MRRVAWILGLHFSLLFFSLINMTEAKEVVAETNGEENNKKEESVDEETSELESSIIRQIEYYFGE